MTRKITVPGVSLEIRTIVTDQKKNHVVSMRHGPDVIVVFISSDSGATTARAMTIRQANGFIKELLDAHQAVKDDVKIAQMERYFDDDQ